MRCQHALSISHNKVDGSIVNDWFTNVNLLSSAVQAVSKTSGQNSTYYLIIIGIFCNYLVSDLGWFLGVQALQAWKQNNILKRPWAAFDWCHLHEKFTHRFVRQYKQCQRGNIAFSVLGVFMLYYLQKRFLIILGSSSVQIRLKKQW